MHPPWGGRDDADASENSENNKRQFQTQIEHFNIPFCLFLFFLFNCPFYFRFRRAPMMGHLRRPTIRALTYIFAIFYNLFRSV